MLDVRFLGTFNIVHAKDSLTITSRPAQSLFAYLIMTAGTPHRREKLAGLLWPKSTEINARDNLRHALWHVRKTLKNIPSDTYIVADDLAIAFNDLSDYQFDVSKLKKVRKKANADELIAAISVYRGELLPGFYDEWAILEREYLNSIFEHYMARLMSILQDENRWLDILNWAERWIRFGQKPEPAYRALMKAHSAKGDMPKVAAIYERCVNSLQEDGISPSEKTNVLYMRLINKRESRETEFIIP